jgi:hypothetical protein
MKTSDLTGNALDWAVGVAEGEQLTVRDRFPCVLNPGGRWNPSSNWSQGGPIIDRWDIALCPGYQWEAFTFVKSSGETEAVICYGVTPLIAAMRCYVASKLGDEVDVPAILP